LHGGHRARGLMFDDEILACTAPAKAMLAGRRKTTAAADAAGINHGKRVKEAWHVTTSAQRRGVCVKRYGARGASSCALTAGANMTRRGRVSATPSSAGAARADGASRSTWHCVILYMVDIKTDGCRAATSPLHGALSIFRIKRAAALNRQSRRRRAVLLKQTSLSFFLHIDECALRSSCAAAANAAYAAGDEA